jgi:hypothetical protein
MNTDRPRLVLKLSPIDKVLEVLSIAGLFFMWVYVLFEYQHLPAIIPIHFDLKGNIDNYGSRWTIFLLPAIISIVVAGLTILTKYPHVFNYTRKITAGNAMVEYTGATRTIRIIKLVIVLFLNMIVYEVVQSARTGHSTLPAWTIIAFMIAMISPVIVSLYLSWKRNSI